MQGYKGYVSYVNFAIIEILWSCFVCSAVILAITRRARLNLRMSSYCNACHVSKEMQELSNRARLQYALGHKHQQSTEIYTHLEKIIFRQTNDKFICAVAKTPEEAKKCIETGFDYVTGEYDDEGKLFRKRR